ncbi:MAG: DMT family transporter [Planctomycetota bacterium]|nr:DMT family transporter [Planctomycetota bacterium]
MPEARILPWRALVAVALWGASLPAVRIALEVFHPVGLVATRMLVGALVLLAVLRARGERLVPERRDLGLCVVLGLVLGAHMLIQVFALVHAPAVDTGWILGFIPVAIALGARVFLRQFLGGVGWLGVAVATAGVLLVTLEEPPDFERAQLGHVLAWITCFTWTAYTLAATGVVKRNGPLRVSAFCVLVAALVPLVPAAWSGFVIADVGGRALFALAFLGILCSGAAQLLWVQALRTDGAARTGATLYLEPFVTVAVAWVVLDEPLTTWVLVGGPTVLVGVWLVGRGSR